MRRYGALAGVLLLALAACRAVPAPSMTPSAPVGASASPPELGLLWHEVAIAQPEIVMEAPSVTPGIKCSPCHPAAASQLFGISPWPDGFIAVGVQQPPPTAIAFHSRPDGTWVPVDRFAPGEGSTAIAVASASATTVVVGSRAGHATAWAMDGTGAWEEARIDPEEAGISSAMTGVVAFRDGFIAAGYRDDPGADRRSAAVWRSDDGRTWQLIAHDGALAGGRAWGVTAAGSRLVAVGTNGDPTSGPPAAWSSDDGTDWRSATITGGGGVMRAVTFRGRLIAVGQDAADAAAAVWTSANGSTWERVAGQDALGTAASPIRMLAIAADERGFVAGGWRADAANGSAAAWTSSDGLTWEQSEWVPSFSGAQIAGVALADGRMLAVGRSGYPDNNQATAWEAPQP